MALLALQATRSFEVMALVVLPDHLHGNWPLPPGDADFATRWRLVKTLFTKDCAPTLRVPRITHERRNESRRYGSTGVGNTC